MSFSSYVALRRVDLVRRRVDAESLETVLVTSPAKDGFVDVVSCDEAGLPYRDLATIEELVGLDSDSEVWRPIPGLPAIQSGGGADGQSKPWKGTAAQDRSYLSFGGVEVWQ